MFLLKNEKNQKMNTLPGILLPGLFGGLLKNFVTFSPVKEFSIK